MVYKAVNYHKIILAPEDLCKYSKTSVKAFNAGFINCFTKKNIMCVKTLNM